MPDKNFAPEAIASWLEEIFPEGFPNREVLLGPATAETLFLMERFGAIEGNDRWFEFGNPSLSAFIMENTGAFKGGFVASPSSHSIPGRWSDVEFQQVIEDRLVRAALVPADIVMMQTHGTAERPRFQLRKGFLALLKELMESEDSHAMFKLGAWHIGKLQEDFAQRLRFTLTMRIGAGLGFHARPTAALTRVSHHFKSGITLTRTDAPGERADARKITEIMGLQLTEGTEVRMDCYGSDAQQAGKAIAYCLSRPDDYSDFEWKTGRR